MVEKFKLNMEKYKKSWLILLQTGTKNKTTSLVKVFPINLNGLEIEMNWNFLSLGSYYVLMWMDFL